jgi:hypothetical protein
MGRLLFAGRDPAGTVGAATVPSLVRPGSPPISLFFRSLQLEGVFPDVNTVRAIVIRHIDAKWAGDLSDRPPSCKAEGEQLKTLEEVEDRIAAIPTRLGLTSACDRDLIYAAAVKQVAEHKDAILRFLNQP